MACSLVWNRFPSREIGARNKPPRVQSIPIPLYRNSKAASRCVSLAVSTAKFSTLIVYRAPDDIQNSDKIRSLLKDIREARQAKSREGLQKIDHSELSVRDSISHLLCALTTVDSCKIYALWKSMRYDPSSCVPWAYSHSSPVTLRPTHDNSGSDYKPYSFCMICT